MELLIMSHVAWAVDCHQCFQATHLVPMQSLCDILPHSINLYRSASEPSARAAENNVIHCNAMQQYVTRVPRTQGDIIITPFGNPAVLHSFMFNVFVVSLLINPLYMRVEQETCMIHDQLEGLAST